MKTKKTSIKKRATKQDDVRMWFVNVDVKATSSREALEKFRKLLGDKKALILIEEAN